MSRTPKSDLPPELKSVLKIVGKNLKSLRDDRGLSQSSLAEKSGVSLTTLNEIESKQHRDIRVSTLVSIAQALNVSLIELFLDTDIEISNSDRDQFLQASQVLQKLSRKLKK